MIPASAAPTADSRHALRAPGAVHTANAARVAALVSAKWSGWHANASVAKAVWSATAAAEARSGVAPKRRRIDSRSGTRSAETSGTARSAMRARSAASSAVSPAIDASRPSALMGQWTSGPASACSQLPAFHHPSANHRSRMFGSVSKSRSYCANAPSSSNRRAFRACAANAAAARSTAAQTQTREDAPGGPSPQGASRCMSARGG
ncbi:MAG: hypothetical protein HMLKMBBP_00896 [Planctomycetes bacterium]|nr:hypothetical protein [Planctomycetota bacterium]